MQLQPVISVRKLKPFKEMTLGEFSLRELLSAFSWSLLSLQQVHVKDKSLTHFSKPVMLVSAVNHCLRS